LKEVTDSYESSPVLTCVPREHEEREQQNGLAWLQFFLYDGDKTVTVRDRQTLTTGYVNYGCGYHLAFLDLEATFSEDKFLSGEPITLSWEDKGEIPALYGNAKIVYEHKKTVTFRRVNEDGSNYVPVP
jgi:hypothetical protein